MKTLLESEEFRAELPGWILRGVLCALNSAFWAIMLGFRMPAEIAGMVAGVACWVVVFAGLCAHTRLAEWLRQPRLGVAFKRAAWIKVGLSALGWLMLAGAGLLRALGAEAISMFGMVDMLLGMAALWLVGRVGGFSDYEHIARLDSFGWTALTTIVEGALMAAVIGLIALGVLAWWRWGGLVRRPTKLSPVRQRD